MSSVNAQSGNAASSSSSSSTRMTGFGNPRFEGAAKKNSGSSLNVTSPKALLGAISNAAGFSNPTRQQLERSLSQEKVYSPSHFNLSLLQHTSASCCTAVRFHPHRLQQGPSARRLPAPVAWGSFQGCWMPLLCFMQSCGSGCSDAELVSRWMHMVGRMTGLQGTSPAPWAGV